MIGSLSPETIITWKLWQFGFRRIPLIFFCRPRVIKITATSLEVKIKLNRRTRNHLHTMYFGVLSVGADITGGFLAMGYCRASRSKISLIFKDFHADFLKRAEGDVHFFCNEGLKIQELVQKAEETGERQNMPVHITARVPSISPDSVAKFILTLSIKKD
jgi:hypothetical protein